ncbi:MAG: flagellar biosynthetic protein FliO [Nitrospirota bacterium]|nr:flagellar biosynthetic protein FliO [Nitrospirota bacterium]
MLTGSHGHEASLVMIGAKLLGSLFFVLALFLAGVYLVRLLQRQKLLAPRRSENEIEIRSTKSLGPKSQIALVSVSGHSFLIGIAPSGISLLGKIDERSIPGMSSGALMPPPTSRSSDPVVKSQSVGQVNEPASFDAAVKEALDRIGAVGRERSSRERSSRWTV